MQNTSLFRRLRHLVLMLLLVTYSVACTHMPSGQKAFDSFESCFAANLGLAAVGGIGVGVLSAKLIGGNAGKNVGVAAGLAAGTMIALHAWKKCGAVYNKSDVVSPPTARPAVASSTASATPRLTLDRLDVRVNGTENDPPQPEFDLSLTTAQPAAKDIKARFRHRVEIVRFKGGENDQLILADDAGNALLDKSGKEIPLAAAARMPRERLSWVAIAEEGKNDYVEDVVLQQGQRAVFKHKLQVPPRAQLALPLPVPMRYTLTAEAENMSATRSVDFYILSTADRPKLYSSSARASALAAGAVPPPPGSAVSSSASSASATTNRRTTLYSDTTAQRHAKGTLPRGTRLHAGDRTTAIINNRPEEWVSVTTNDGRSGWIPGSHLSGGR